MMLLRINKAFVFNLQPCRLFTTVPNPVPPIDTPVFKPYQIKPADLTKLLVWRQSVMSDQNTKKVVVKGLTRLKFQLNEADLEEQFIKGFGPGGQKTNKSNNCVVLLHRPTGEHVKCHDSREQAANRGIARKLLYERLDLLLNPDSSTITMRVEKKQKAKAKAAYRARKAAEMRSPDSANDNINI